MKKASPPNRLTRFLAVLGATLLVTSAHAAETLTYYHWDALGSPVAATDFQGNVVWREEYKPYGERIKNEAAAQANTRWYTGHPHDTATGLTYTGARYYDPAVGRFMGVDPVSFTESDPHTFNRYAYANNNPYTYTDPDGYSPLDEKWRSATRGMNSDAGFGPGGGPAGGRFQFQGPEAAQREARGLAAEKMESALSRETVSEGDKVFRVWGGKSGPWGESWTTVDPRKVDNYRDAAGLPSKNTGRFVSEGTIKDASGISRKSADPLDGNRGGLPELKILDPRSKVELERVSGANPEF